MLSVVPFCPQSVLGLIRANMTIEMLRFTRQVANGTCFHKTKKPHTNLIFVFRVLSPTNFRDFWLNSNFNQTFAVCRKSEASPLQRNNYNILGIKKLTRNNGVLVGDD